MRVVSGVGVAAAADASARSAAARIMVRCWVEVCRWTPVCEGFRQVGAHCKSLCPAFRFHLEASSGGVYSLVAVEIH